jgi:hypothetical protein
MTANSEKGFYAAFMKYNLLTREFSQKFKRKVKNSQKETGPDSGTTIH